MGGALCDRRAEYKAYLGSDIWAELRALALARANGACERCAAPAAQVHHVRYPKRFAGDHPDNLMALCDRCHRREHGIVDLYEITNFERREDIGPFESRLHYIVEYTEPPRLWLSAERSARFMKLPPTFGANWAVRLATRATAMTIENIIPGPMRGKAQAGPEDRPIEVFRFEVIVRTLSESVVRYQAEANQPGSYVPAADREENEQWIKTKFRRFEAWYLQAITAAAVALVGCNQQRERTAIIPAPRRELMLPGGAEEKFYLLFGDHAARIDRLTVDVREIKAALPRFADPNEFVTVAQRLSEVGIPAELCPNYTARNWGEETGSVLRRTGAVADPEELTMRLSGNGLRRTVRKWRREDIDCAIRNIRERERAGGN